MQIPQVIFFDAVGTLFGVRGTVGEIYGQFAQRAGLDVNVLQLNQAFIHSFRSAPRVAFSTADLQAIPRLEYEWWRSVARQSFERIGELSNISDFDGFFQPLFDYFAIADPWMLYPEVPQVLAQLNSLGFELAIISNFDSRLYAVLEALDLKQWFSSVTLSTQVGSAKPERDIFGTALAIHGYSPAQAWHVGDSWTEDYQGATAAGLQGIWLNRDRLATPVGMDETPCADIEIGELSMLQAILHP